jgi:protein TonB
MQGGFVDGEREASVGRGSAAPCALPQAQRMSEPARPITAATGWSPSLLRDWRLVGGLLLSLVAHAVAVAGMTVVRFGPDRPPILVDLGPLAPSGPPGEAQAVAPRKETRRSAESPRPARAVAAASPPEPAPAAPVPAMTEPVPPPPVPLPPARHEEPAPPPPAVKADRPPVQAPTFGGAGLAAAVGANAARSPGAADTSITPVQGSLISRVAPDGNVGAASRAWGATPGTAGHGSFTAPRFELQRKPRYPEAARRDGVEGTTLVKARVLADGSVGAAEVRRSSGSPELDRAAVEAIRDSRFLPAERGGTPVAVWIEIPVVFNLEQ